MGWSWNWFESLARDLRYSLRTLGRTPRFTVVAILVMALGIGANVALFTVVRGVLLKPLPFQDPDGLVMLYEAGVHEDGTAGSNVVSGGMYAEWKKQNRSYSSLALAQGIRVGLSSVARIAARSCAGVEGGIVEFPLFVTSFPQQKISRSTSISVTGE